MFLSLSCSPFLSCATQLPASSSSASASPSFPKLRPFSMFRILRSVPDPRTGRIFSYQDSLVRDELGWILRAERSSNFTRKLARTKSSELSAHQIMVRTHLGQSLRAELKGHLERSTQDLLYRSILRPVRHIWAEPADRIYSERSAHYWLSPVRVRPSQAAPQVSASPYVVFFTRVTRWIPRLPAEPRMGFFPFFWSRSCTLLRSFPLLGLSDGFQRELCTCSRQAFRSLLCCHSTLLSSRHMTATLRRSPPLQGPPSGRSVAYRVSSPISLLTTRLAPTGMVSSSSRSSTRKVKEDTWREGVFC